MAEDDAIYAGAVDIYGHPADKRKTGKWKASRFILGNACCEGLAYYGVSMNLINYFQKHLNQGAATASTTVTNWTGTCYVTPLIGAFLADSYLGRYWTIASFSIIYFLGMMLLTLSASIQQLEPISYVALYMIALGTGGTKPCVSSFGANQFDDTEDEMEGKSSFFNWYYVSINIGAVIASMVLVWVQTNVGWGWGFGVPAISMAFAVVFFFSGSNLYWMQKPGGSPLTRIAQVIVASFRKMNVQIPTDKSLLYETGKCLLYETVDAECVIHGSRKLEHTDGLRFFDKAAVETLNDQLAEGRANPWRLCTVTQVEELKSIIRLLPVWASGIIFTTIYSQMNTMFVLQGNTMDQHVGPHLKIPSASLSLVDTVSVVLMAPIYDRVIVPFARTYTGHQRGFTQLQRMGIGHCWAVT
ncbi:hypothetical protein CDL15_Pgr007742 [Punica granatum]|uniref:Protein NRT1/ PTR FAMILY 8.1-like n=1 Tax=Punica granatum TaxID=22663 RepID=A0A218X9W1_PUNGR|nr:hypothetical protein CDL15_Pgr007742 [Punica granatum]